MVFYTHDGVRHETEAEALEYLGDNFISEVLPTDDDYYTAIHAHDWGKYELQAIPDSITEHLQIQLTRYHEGMGYSILNFNDSNPVEDVEELLKYLDKERLLLDMVRSVIQESVSKWSSDGKHVDVNTVESSINVQLRSRIESTLTGMTKFIEYRIDNLYSGVVDVSEGNVLKPVMKDIESHLTLELEGELSSANGVLSLDGFNIGNFLSTASLLKHQLTIKVEQPEVTETKE